MVNAYEKALNDAAEMNDDWFDADRTLMAPWLDGIMVPATTVCDMFAEVDRQLPDILWSQLEDLGMQESEQPRTYAVAARWLKSEIEQLYD